MIQPDKVTDNGAASCRSTASAAQKSADKQGQGQKQTLTGTHNQSSCTHVYVCLETRDVSWACQYHGLEM
jgi:hypothetical protein